MPLHSAAPRAPADRPRPLAAGLLALAAALLLAAPRLVSADCAGWTAGPMFATDTGPDGPIRAVQVWDPDGLGPMAPWLVVAGDFLSINGVPARHVAAWDGLVWHALGSGPAGTIYSLGVYNGALVAGGTLASFSSQVPDVEAWTGSAWERLASGLAGTPDTVFALAAYNGELIAGGHLDSPTRNIAAYDGTSFHPIGAGMNGTVYAFAVIANVLYAGGAFSLADTTHAKYAAQWNGSSWSRVDDGSGRGPAQPVLAIAASGSDIFMGCAYPAATGVVRWDGASWHAAGTLCGSVLALAPSGGLLYAGGDFNVVDGCTQDRIAVWNGSDWGPVGGGINPAEGGTLEHVSALASYGGALFAGGYFSSTNAGPLAHLGEWTGANWVAPHAPLSVDALAVYGSKLAAGGYVTQSLGTGQAYYLLTWDGLRLGTAGTGTDAPVYALKGYTDTSAGQPRQNLVVGGAFTHAGGVAAAHVGLWSEAATYPFNTWSALGSGFDGNVNALELYGGAIVAGGAFANSGATATAGVARWDGSAWQPMGSGMNAPVWALKAYSPTAQTIALVAGGDFTVANGGAASRVAIWTQSTIGPATTPWKPLGDGFNGRVYALERFGGSLYAAGAFTATGTGAVALNSLARWTGSAWVAVGSTPGGGVNGTVYALRADGSYLYAVGEFTSADGVPAGNVARWNGATWSAVGGGTGGAARALTPFHGEMLAGGDFTWAESSALPSPGVARFIETGVPWLNAQPAAATVNAGDAVEFTLGVPTGYDSLGFQWRRNGLPLSDGPTGNGSDVTGSQTQFLLINGVAPADSGFYACLAGDACGTVLSDSAALAVAEPTAVGGPAPGSGLALLVGPSPTAGAAGVGFFLRAAGRAEAAVYDPGGRRVRRLLAGSLPAGPQKLAWDGRDDQGRRVPAGLYFVRVAGAGQIQTQRLVLLR
ncbi:MAG TPA: FlgD immunoglobulin-like domain containing protein [Candidatus Eisenbacteria bacterium]|nr:FlgD immunoglobulin-like domain containing protein [Candidatus Eisenbacteria bacterium]